MSRSSKREMARMETTAKMSEPIEEVGVAIFKEKGSQGWLKAMSFK